MNAVQATAPATTEAGNDKPNCSKSIIENAAETMTMQKGTSASRRPCARWVALEGPPVATASATGARPLVAFELSCLPIGFCAANRFDYDKLRRLAEQRAMLGGDLSPGFASP